jgi:hypothetical protein
MLILWWIAFWLGFIPVIYGGVYIQITRGFLGLGHNLLIWCFLILAFTSSSRMM